MALMLAAGAFLAWGPIGLGNGPLAMSAGGEQGWADMGRVPAVLVIPVSNNGDRPAVIDGVQFLGHAGYPAPAVFAVRAITYTNCAGGWPLRTGPHGPIFVPADCGANDLGPLIGHAVPSGTDPPVIEAVAAARPPAPDSCWALTAIVVHYHVGIRHYSATSADAFAVCAGQAASDTNLQRAMDAAGAAAPQ